MGHSKRRGHPLRRWAIPGTGLGGPKRRRSLARTEQEPEVDIDMDVGIRYRDASGVWQGGRDGIGWTRHGDYEGGY